MSRVTLKHWSCPHCLMLPIHSEVRKSFIGEFLLSHPAREIDDNLREFESHFTTVTSHQKAGLQNLMTRDGSRDTRVTLLWCTALTDLTPTESLRALTVVCPLHTPHTPPGVSTTLCLQPQTLHSVNIDTTRRHTSTQPLIPRNKRPCLTAGWYLAFLWVHQINCHWDLDWNINRPASHIRHDIRSQKSVSLKDWLNISGIFITSDL